MIGKPYSGKPNVRFDEGELEIEPVATTPALYSTESVDRDFSWALFAKSSVGRDKSFDMLIGRPKDFFQYLNRS